MARKRQLFTKQMEKWMASVDDVLARLGTLVQAIADEQTQVRTVLTELRDQIAAGSTDPAKLDEAVALLDSAIADTANLVEAASVEEPPPEG